MNLYKKNDQWDPKWSKAYVTALPIQKRESYNFLTHTFCIKRKNLYHINNIIVSSTAISFLAAFGFLVPSYAGEKISYQITVILSFTVFQLKVADSVPENGVSIPVICM